MWLHGYSQFTTEGFGKAQRLHSFWVPSSRRTTFLKYFYSQEMLTSSEIKFKLHLILTLSVELQTIMTFYEENYGQNELNL